jgi:hypothetical protein
MASYLGASYQAAVGPSDHDVTLFAAPPPPEEHGFSPAPGGIWRKQVRLNDLDGLWESRPIGSYHGEPCLVLDDLGDRLHIVYLGMDGQRAAQLGYWEVDRGVFEVVVPRHDITDLAEERHEFPIALLLSALPRALGAGDPGSAGGGFGQNGTGAASGGPVSSGPVSSGPVSSGPVSSGPVSSGTAPAGMTGWNGPTAAPQPARGQLPAGSPAQLPQAPLPQAQLQQAQLQQAQLQQAQLPPGQLSARPQQPAATGQQFPAASPYQLPAGPERGAGLPGAPGPATTATTPGAQGVSPRGEAAPGSAPQLSGGQQAPGGQQFTGMAAGPGAPYAPGGQQGVPGMQPAAMNQAQPPAGPPLPGRPQLPMAQQAPGAQQPFAQQFSQPSPLTTPQAPGTARGSGPQQALTAQSAPAQQAPAQQALAQPAQPPAQSAQPPAPSAPQTPPAPARDAAAAWHGSPAPDGSGTWYFQPGPDPQDGAASGYPVNGMPQGGYAQPDQGTVQAAPPGGPAGPRQYAQPAPQAPGPAYQQAPAPAGQLQGGQLQGGQLQGGQPAPLGTLPPPAQQAAPAPQFQPQPPPSTQQAPLPAQPAGTASLAGPAAQAPAMTAVPPTLPPVAAAPAMTAPASALPAPPAAPVPAAAADVIRTGPPPAPGQQTSGGLAAGALGKLTGAVRGRRAARKPRLAMSAIFADLVDMADIPRSAYAVDEEVTGAMCLFKTEGGYEVFSCAEDARHEVRFFEEEESAYFYLFGVLAAEALRNGRLSPRRG